MHLGYQLNFKNEHKRETKMFITLNKKSHPERQTIEYGGQVYISKINEDGISKVLKHETERKMSKRKTEIKMGTTGRKDFT